MATLQRSLAIMDFGFTVHQQKALRYISKKLYGTSFVLMLKDTRKPQNRSTLMMTMNHFTMIVSVSKGEHTPPRIKGLKFIAYVLTTRYAKSF